MILVKYMVHGYMHIIILTIAQGCKEFPVQKKSFVKYKIQQDVYDDSFTEHPAKGRQKCIME